MARFTAGVDLNIRLPGGEEVIGVAGTTHRISDALVTEFARDQAPHIPGFAWVTQDETSGIPTLPLAQSDITNLVSDLSAKFAAAGGIISGAVTATGALVAQTSVSTPSMTATSARFKGSPWHDVTAYGAVGDNSADDTAAIQSAVDAAASGGHVYFPAGTYKITAAVTVSVPVQLSGPLGREAPAAIVRQATASAIGLNFTSTAQPSVIADLGIYGAATTATTASVGVKAAKDVHLDRVTVKGFYDNVEVGAGSYYATINGSFLFSAINANVSLVSGMTNLTIGGGTRMAYGKYGIYGAGSVRGVRMTGGAIEQMSQFGVYIDGAYASQVALSQIWFETSSAQSGAPGGFVRLGASAAVKAASIRDNLFFPTDVASFYAIDASNTTALVIDGNLFGSTGAGGGPFRLTGTVQDVSVGENLYQAVAGAVYASAVSLRWHSSGENYNQLSASTNALLSGRVAADTTGRFVVDASGKLAWGTGTAVRDTTLERISGPFLSASVAVMSPIIGAQVSATAAISCNNNSVTILAFTAETFDTDSFHESVTNPSRITIPAAYNGMKGRLFANVTWAANSVGLRRVEILKSGATLVARDSRLAVASADLTDHAVQTPWLVLATGDYFEVRCTQNSGGALNVNSSASYSPIFGIEISGT